MSFPSIQPQTRPIENSVGEIEQDTTAPQTNLREALTVFAILLSAQWLFIDFLGQQGYVGLVVFDYVGYLIIVLAACWALVISPRWHQDSLDARGVGQPLEVVAILARSGWRDRIRILAIILIVTLLVGVAVFGDINSLYYKLGTDHAERLLDQQGSPTVLGLTLGLVMVLGIATLLCLLIVRFDNVTHASRRMTIPLLIGVALIIALGLGYAAVDETWIVLPSARIHNWSWGSLVAKIGVYIVWAHLQLWLLLGYFNTRLRKGLTRQSSRLIQAPLAVALASGVIFSLIHAPNLPLMLVTFCAGAVLGDYFQYDRSRNLYVMSFCLGVGGTLLQQFTPIDGTVGLSTLSDGPVAPIAQQWDLSGLPQRVKVTPETIQTQEGKPFVIAIPRTSLLSDVWIQVSFAASQGEHQLSLASDGVEIRRWHLAQPGQQRALIPRALLEGRQSLTITPLVSEQAADALIRISDVLLWEDQLQLGHAIDFGEQGSSEIYRGAGWSRPEGEGTWTDGRRAALSIRVPHAPGGLELRAFVAAFRVQGKLNWQEVNLYANGLYLGQWQVRNRRIHEVEIPPEAIQDGRLDLILDLPDAISPASLGVNEDVRALGVSFRYLDIRALDVAPVPR